MGRLFRVVLCPFRKKRVTQWLIEPTSQLGPATVSLTQGPKSRNRIDCLHDATGTILILLSRAHTINTYCTRCLCMSKEAKDKLANIAVV
ncbi:unnamed protein product [Caenorhabditis nigoni]